MKKILITTVLLLLLPLASAHADQQDEASKEALATERYIPGLGDIMGPHSDAACQAVVRGSNQKLGAGCL